MIKRKIILLLFMFCSSCVGSKTGPLCQKIYRSEMFSQKTKTFLCGEGRGIKYRCKKVSDCCEVGKDCENDNLEKEVKK